MRTQYMICIRVDDEADNDRGYKTYHWMALKVVLWAEFCKAAVTNLCVKVLSVKSDKMCGKQWK